MSSSLISFAKFSVGELIHHRLFGYRGVIIGIDPEFQGSEEWYEHVARSRPPRDQPWYRVLPHDTTHQTYVAERNLEPDDSQLPIEHPEVNAVFDGFDGGSYQRRDALN